MRNGNDIVCGPPHPQEQRTVRQMMAIEDKNRRLKRMYADLGMQNDLLNCEGERNRFE